MGIRKKNTIIIVVIREIFKHRRIMNLEKLIQENPNDMELGKKVRDLYLKNKKVFEKYKHLKIYESPS